jgi:uncharacterized membrane protein
MNFKKQKSSTAVLIMMALYAVFMSLVCFLKYSHFSYDDFDLAIHTQSLAAIIHGSSITSILGIPFLGNHMVLILYPIAPLYAIFHTPVLLLALQSIALAAGAWPVYRIAREKLSPPKGVAFAAIYLIYYPMLYLNLYEFHPVALASTFILYAWLFRLQNRFGAFMLFLALAMSCQENIALITTGFGVLAIFERRRWWWSLLPIATGTVYFVLVTGFIMPRLNSTVNFMALYAHLGDSMPDVIKNIIIHPLNTVRVITEPRKLSFINQLLMPLAYLPILNPLTWIPAAPVVMQRLLSNRATEFVIIFHYQAEFIPFIFISAIYATAWLGRLPQRVAGLLPLAALAVFPLLGLITSGTIPLIKHNIFLPQNLHPLISAKHEFVNTVSPDAKIAATFDFLAPFSGHSQLHSIHHIASGHYTLSAKPYPIPRDLDIIVIDTNDRMTFSPRAFYSPQTYLRLQALLQTGKWEIATHEESLLALRRSTCNSPELPLAVEIPRIPRNASTNITQSGTANFNAIGFELAAEPDGRFSNLAIYWKTPPDTPCTDADILLSISLPDTPLYEVILSPGSRFWPPQSWPANAVMRDLQRIPISAATTNAHIHLTMLPMTWQRGI